MLQPSQGSRNRDRPEVMNNFTRVFLKTLRNGLIFSRDKNEAVVSLVGLDSLGLDSLNSPSLLLDP